MFSQAPCCGTFYPCRFCHDAKENHEINRYEINSVKCKICGTTQKASDRIKNMKTIKRGIFLS